MTKQSLALACLRQLVCDDDDGGDDDGHDDGDDDDGDNGGADDADGDDYDGAIKLGFALQRSV